MSRATLCIALSYLWLLGHLIRRNLEYSHLICDLIISNENNCSTLIDALLYHWYITYCIKLCKLGLDGYVAAKGNLQQSFPHIGQWVLGQMWEDHTYWLRCTTWGLFSRYPIVVHVTTLNKSNQHLVNFGTCVNSELGNWRTKHYKSG